MGLISIDSIANKLNFFGWTESKFGYVGAIVRGSEDSHFKDFIYIGGSFTYDLWPNWHLAFIKITDVGSLNSIDGSTPDYTLSILKFDSHDCRMSFDIEDQLSESNAPFISKMA